MNIKIINTSRNEDNENNVVALKIKIRSIKYKLENINFFDLVVESENDIINVEKYVIYKNIYKFKNRINTLVEV